MQSTKFLIVICIRETPKTAILIFNRQKNFSDVLAQIRHVGIPFRVLKGPSQKLQKRNGGLSFAIATMPNREVHLSVLAFDIPQLPTYLREQPSIQIPEERSRTAALVERSVTFLCLDLCFTFFIMHFGYLTTHGQTENFRKLNLLRLTAYS